MAIAVGSEVALTRAVGVTLGANGKVVFGICVALSDGAATVVWDNGQSAEAIPVAQLDQIAPGTAQPGICEFTDGGNTVSPAYQCAVERAYSRASDGGVNSPVNYLLLKSVSTGIEYEAPAAAVEFIAGQ